MRAMRSRGEKEGAGQPVPKKPKLSGAMQAAVRWQPQRTRRAPQVARVAAPGAPRPREASRVTRVREELNRSVHLRMSLEWVLVWYRLSICVWGGRYFAMDVDIDEIRSPLEWWRVHRGAFPILSKLAARYLTIPASSASCERVFSQAGLTLTKLRNRMDVDLLEALMTIKYQHQDDWQYVTPAEWIKTKEGGLYEVN